MSSYVFDSLLGESSDMQLSHKPAKFEPTTFKEDILEPSHLGQIFVAVVLDLFEIKNH